MKNTIQPEFNNFLELFYDKSSLFEENEGVGNSDMDAIINSLVELTIIGGNF